MPKTETQNLMSEELAKLCSEPDTKALELILPKADLYDIAFQIINVSRTLKGIIQPSHKYRLSFNFRTNQEADLVSNFVSAILHKQDIHYMAYVFYPDSDICTQKLHLLTTAASKRLQGLSVEAFDAEYQILFSLAHQNLTQNQCDSTSRKQKAFYILLGCEYLLMTYAELNFGIYAKSPYKGTIGKEEFLQQRAGALYTKIIAIVEASSDIPNIPPSEKKELIELYKKVRDNLAPPVVHATPAPVIMNPQAPSSPKASAPSLAVAAEKVTKVAECKGL
jgi:hypothetical protein